MRATAVFDREREEEGGIQAQLIGAKGREEERETITIVERQLYA